MNDRHEVLATDDHTATSWLYCHIDGNRDHHCSAHHRLLVIVQECALVCQSNGLTYYHRD